MDLTAHTPFTAGSSGRPQGKKKWREEEAGTAESGESSLHLGNVAVGSAKDCIRIQQNRPLGPILDQTCPMLMQFSAIHREDRELPPSSSQQCSKPEKTFRISQRCKEGKGQISLET